MNELTIAVIAAAIAYLLFDREPFPYPDACWDCKTLDCGNCIHRQKVAD